jgi:hypothetical protein
MKPKNLLVLGIVLAMMVPASAVAGKKYLAVYINEGDLTFSTGQGPTLEAASQIAAESCGPKCKRACYSYDACVALAIARGGTCWGCSWGNSVSEASAKALKICNGYGCKCAVIMDECYR